MANYAFGTPWSGATPPATPDSLASFEADIASNLTITNIGSGDYQTVTGWADATETADRTALTAYTPQTMSAGYVQAEVQNLDNQLVIVSRTLAALINDLFTRGWLGT
jgi:hypothetical protein